MPSEDAFVGRSGELAVLDQELARVRTGQPRLVWLTGEAGIGKTSLLHRFVDRLTGVRLLWGSGDEDEAGLPYGVLSQLVAGLPPAASGRLDWSDHLRPDADPLAVGAVLLAELGALQSSGPIVVVVDDAHWADDRSVQALIFVLRRLRNDQVLVLLSARSESPTRRGDLGPRSGPEPARPTAVPRRPERRRPEKVVAGGGWATALARGQPPAARTHRRSSAVRPGPAAGASPGGVAGDHGSVAGTALARLAGPRAAGQGEPGGPDAGPRRRRPRLPVWPVRRGAGRRRR